MAQHSPGTDKTAEGSSSSAATSNSALGTLAARKAFLRRPYLLYHPASTSYTRILRSQDAVILKELIQVKSRGRIVAENFGRIREARIWRQGNGSHEK